MSKHQILIPVEALDEIEDRAKLTEQRERFEFLKSLAIHAFGRNPYIEVDMVIERAERLISKLWARRGNLQ